MANTSDHVDQAVAATKLLFGDGSKDSLPPPDAMQTAALKVLSPLASGMRVEKDRIVFVAPTDKTDEVDSALRVIFKKMNHEIVFDRTVAGFASGTPALANTATVTLSVNEKAPALRKPIEIEYMKQALQFMEGNGVTLPKSGASVAA